MFVLCESSLINISISIFIILRCKDNIFVTKSLNCVSKPLDLNNISGLIILRSECESTKAMNSY